MYIIKCQICGKEFEAKRSHAKYCVMCQREANRRNMSARRKAIRETIDEAHEIARLEAKRQWEQEQIRHQNEVNAEYERLKKENPDYFFDMWMKWRNEGLSLSAEGQEANWIIGGISIHDNDFENRLRELLSDESL